MVDDRTLPPLEGREPPHGAHIKLPGFSFAFYILTEARAPVCKWALIETAFTGESGLCDDKIFCFEIIYVRKLQPWMKWISLSIWKQHFLFIINIELKPLKTIFNDQRW